MDAPSIRHEIISELISLTKEEFINIFQSTYAKKRAKSKRYVLRDFQLELKNLVQSWKPEKFDNDSRVQELCKRLKTMNVGHLKWSEALTCMAREFWRKPVLFYDDVPRKEYLENILTAEKTVINCLKTMLRRSTEDIVIAPIEEVKPLHVSKNSDSGSDNKSDSGSESNSDSGSDDSGSDNNNKSDSDDSGSDSDDSGSGSDIETPIDNKNDDNICQSKDDLSVQIATSLSDFRKKVEEETQKPSTQIIRKESFDGLKTRTITIDENKLYPSIESSDADSDTDITYQVPFIESIASKPTQPVKVVGVVNKPHAVLQQNVNKNKTHVPLPTRVSISSQYDKYLPKMRQKRSGK